MSDELAILKQTMAAIAESQTLLGQDVVDTTMAVLRQKLADLAEASDVFEESHPEQRKQVTMLFARVSGAGRLVNLQQGTQLLSVMNMLWRFLDVAITDHGGTIDKHLTSGVMGVFGVPVAREDDPERAIRAALAMQQACINFAADYASSLEEDDNGEIKLVENNLQLRVGINTGPVLLGEIGSAEEYTVIGSAVNVASRLEETAVNGGIFISQDTYTLVEDIFKIKPLGQVEIKGKREPVPAFEVIGVRPRTEGEVSRGVGGIETRMVGRDAEMSILQEIVRETAKSGQGRVVTIVGEAGVGKTRLISEFQSWLMTMPALTTIFRGQSDQRMSHLPYALIRDMFSLFFSIQDNERMMVAESKLVSGMSEFLDPEEVDIHDRAHAIGQLIGLNLATGFLNSAMLNEPMVARDRVFDYVAEFFTAVTAAHTVTVVVLEDLHWADEGSLALIRHVSDVCRHLPLVIVGLTRSIRHSLAHLLSGEEELEYQATAAHEIIELSNLTRKDTRRLVFDILQKAPKVPDALTNLVVERAEGNPFFVEELVKILIEDGAIIPGDEEWLVKNELRDTMRIPPTLTGILQARLDRLTSLERKTLQRAAVIGRIFWDLTIAHLGDTYNDAVLAETRAALQALEKRELIFRRSISTFAGTKAYYFKHAILRDVTYESVLLRERPLYHRRVADWLSHQSGQRVAEYAGLIAEHYELAGENISAAELYEMAAGRAEETFNPTAAIEYYRKSISLLTDEQHHIAWQLQLQERVGKLLLRQAQLLDAEQTYMAMRFMAEQDGDLNAQAHAWNGLASLRREQADFQAMV
ncbi:MAG: adenylate/guanylate cyclase domain-containing protein, partial [Anaerolineae bacterium]